MPKIFGKEVGLIWIAAGGAIATYLFFTVAFPAPETIAAAPRKKPTASTKKKTDIYVESDYTIRYAAVSEPIRDSFKPLIIREERASAVAGGIPAAFAAGDGNWVYSGMAKVNGVPQALLENRTSGDYAFVTNGARWKTATIGGITEDTITLSGPGGMSLTLAAGGPSEPSPAENVTTPQPISPVPVPGMNGQIGGNNRNQPWMPGNGNNNNGGRRGGRRGGNNFGNN